MNRDAFKNAVNALIDEAVPTDTELGQEELNSLCDTLGDEIVSTITESVGDEEDEDEDVADEQAT